MEDPQRKLRVWPVYALTALTAPLSAWMIAVFNAAYALGYALLRIAQKKAASSDFSYLSQTALARILQKGVLQIVIGVAGNATIFASVALAAAFFNRGKDADGPRPKGWKRLRLYPVPWIEVLFAVGGLVAFTSALDAVVQLIGLGDVGKLAEYRAQISALDSSDRVLLALFLGFAAGIGEELFFRGYMLTRLELAHGRIAALLVTSMIFGIFHWDIIHSPLAALMGAYLGLIVLVTGSLWASIAAHVVNNLVATLFVEAELSVTAVWSFLVAGLLIAAAALWALERRGRGRESRRPLW